MKKFAIDDERKKVRKSELNRGRAILVLLIVLSSLFPLIFIRPEAPDAETTLYFLLAKFGSLSGAILLFWQFFLGFRGTVSRLFPDILWVVDLHKKLGQYGTLIIPLHPIFIGLFYYRIHRTNIYILDLGTSFSQWVFLGMILLGLIAFIVISSAFFRKKTGFYTWFYTHLSAYVVPPLLFFHAIFLGSTVRGTFFRYIWWSLAGVMGAYYLYRIFHKFGFFARNYIAVQARTVAEETTEITMKPGDGGIKPAPGQFIYIRESPEKNAHPYTVSDFNEESGALSITSKKTGPQSSRLQETAAGERFILDGPYGVFTRVAVSNSLPIVMIAGGIGITPFRRLWQRIEHEKDREAWLFYGNEHYADIVYREELDSLKHVRVVHILNEEPDFPGEKGFVTMDVLARHLERALSEYQFLICGPPVMIVTLEQSLREAGIHDDRIQHELFST